MDGTSIIVFYPAQGVSAVQKAQMVTQSGRNVRVCALRGNFDDCQRGVKRAFSDINSSGTLSGSGLRLSSANSINIGRLAPQLLYYFIAYRELLRRGRISLGQSVDYVVPTGNFGDILAGYYARLMGLPVGRLVCASNENRVLTDFIDTGCYDARRSFIMTSSPSMDILISSNLERLLYLSSGGDTERVSGWMEALNRDGRYSVDMDVIQNIRSVFSAFCCGETQCAETMGRVWKEFGYLSDPHTAVGFAAAEKYKAERSDSDGPIVVLSTASPYKFPAAVLKALGGDTSGDEFTQMDSLEKLSGLPIPGGLSGLREKTALHRDEICRDELGSYVLELLKEMED